MSEELLVSALLARPELLASCSDLGLDHFAGFRPRLIYQTIRNVEAIGIDITVESVVGYLENEGKGDALSDGRPNGTRMYLEGLRGAAEHADASAVGMLVDSVKRAAGDLADVMRDAYGDAQPDETYKPDADNGPDPAPKSMIVGDVALLDTPPIRSYSTGNAQLDELTGGGLNSRELCVVMGPPGTGKTAYAISVSIHIAKTVAVLYGSTELEQHEIMARIAANILGRSTAGIRRGYTDRARVVAALAGVNIYVLGCDVLPRDGDEALKLIESEAKRIAALNGEPPIVVIDYLQDLARGAEQQLRARVGDLATEARAMAQRLDTAVLAVSSVSRTFYGPKKAAEMRQADDPTVYLAAAKESGDVDYAAARVLFLDVETDRNQPERDARIAVAKSRDGRAGFAGARFAGECGRWLTSPGSLEVFSGPGQAEETSSDTQQGDDTFMLKRLKREWTTGKGELCTRSYLRAGNKGVGVPRATAAIDRLVLSGLARESVVARVENGKQRERSVLEPVSK